MIVLKFGGTSVGTPSGMQNIYDIVSKYTEPICLVLSALSGTTNSLEYINELIKKEKSSEALLVQKDLLDKYFSFTKSLFQSEHYLSEINEIISEYFSKINLSITENINGPNHFEILTFGELLSTQIFYFYSLERKSEITLLPALEFMRVDKSNEPDFFYIKQRINSLISSCASKVFITQGYICRNSQGEIENLKRGGSDYTATIIGNVLNSKRVEIWTDIDGMHNNDPRFVDGTTSIKYLDYDEASELAYFGAKILHPDCVFPVKELNIPLLLKNTMEPLALGTMISNQRIEDNITAIAAKDDITAIKIKSVRMLNAYGFLSQVFEVFNRHKTPIDMITTSEVAISLTIDDSKFLKEIINDLKEFGDVEFQIKQSIICVVGDFSEEKTSEAHLIFSALKNIPIRMISYGGSKRNVSILVETKFKIEALTALQNTIFLN